VERRESIGSNTNGLHRDHEREESAMNPPHVEKQPTGTKKKPAKSRKASAKVLAAKGVTGERHAPKLLKKSTAKDIVSQIPYTGAGDDYTLTISGTAENPVAIIDPSC
jgi:hypothetical protein